MPSVPKNLNSTSKNAIFKINKIIDSNKSIAYLFKKQS